MKTPRIMNPTIKILIENIRVPYQKQGTEDVMAMEDAGKVVHKQLGSRPLAMHINKKSIDARRKSQISFVYSVYAEIENSPKMEEKIHSKGIKRYTEPELHLTIGTEKPEHRPVIIGFGPAGLFCGMILAEYGYRPLILERGADVETRAEQVRIFKETGVLNTNSNIQFGAGGAGTFSDGKLTTRIHDPLMSYVTKVLCELGAPEDIAWKAKPHIGTDVLVKVVAAAHERILEHGGEIRYNTTVEHISDGSIVANGEKIPYSSLIIAAGHSARDLYDNLISGGFVLTPKPFSVGVRIEHLQDDLNRAMFGDLAGDTSLGAAEYQVSYREGERGCYSFCMCPGGEVVPAASEEFGVVTNGMSKRARDGKNANAAICVSVHPEDYGSTPDKAIEFQRNLERTAFHFGGSDYYAPMQTVGDFLNGQKGSLPDRVIPSYRDNRVRPCDFHDIFPGFISGMLENGLRHFDKQINGFAASHVPMTVVETRTSAPVRILRTEELTAVGHDNIYPCGEGAGYAGGIVSAAVDGLRVARQILARYSPF